jgi:starch synthase
MQPIKNLQKLLKMEIIHIAAECYPVAKVGGLGDVVGALPKYQKEAGHHVKVILPGYDTKFISEHKFDCIHEGFVKLANFNFPFRILKESTEQLGFELYLVAIPELFDRKEVYGYEDDIERFLCFQMATLDWLTSRNELPDVINCHDHHTGLIPFMMYNVPKYSKLISVPTVITIHNSIYQGQFGFDKLYYLPEFDLSKIPLIEWDNRINSLASAIKCASAVTTVSPNYLNEINYSAYGLEYLFKQERQKSKGILNGIDFDVWNPATDKMIEKNFSVKNLAKGKQENKKALCVQFNLDSTKPLYSFIGRLLEEKGADLLPEVVGQALLENPKGINILILGSGNLAIETQLTAVLANFVGNYNVFIGYNEALAHLIYAGSDFLLMPSRVEPCGLNQMYAMRYGTIPIVRRTGGLKDTVVDFGDGGNGICHEQASVIDVCDSIKRAVTLYQDSKAIAKIRKLGMSIDHSWESVCQEYIDLYNLIISKNES